MCQTGCATSSQNYLPDPIVIEIRPPEGLLMPCRMPEPTDIEMNGDLLDLLMATVDALQRCAAKVEAIRKFYRGE